MGDFPRAPRPRSGGLALFDGATGEVCHAVEFQYNPARLLHVLETPLDPEGDRPRVETITLSTELDATDSLEAGDELAAEVGIGHRIAAFFALLRPPAPCADPFVVLLLGPTRRVPVHVAELSVSEEAFDPRLNPVRAVVSMTLEVLESARAKSAAAAVLEAQRAEQSRLAGLGAASLGSQAAG